MNEPLTRAQVAPEQTWNLDDLFATRDAWLAELTGIEEALPTVTAHQGRLGEADPRMRRWVLMQVLGTYHHNFVTHLLEAQLQREVYRLAEAGQPVTAALLNERKAAILQAFWGDAVVIDAGAAMTWMRQPHYYFGLYPYTYSVGLVAATALAEKARSEGDGVFADWLAVLRAGGTLEPMALMRQVGIDLSSPQPVRDAVACVGRMIDELEASF